MENQDVHGAALQIMEAMKQQGSSTDRLKNYRSTYNVFERFLSSSGITHVDADVCMEVVYQKTGKRYDSFECVTSDGGVDNRMRPLLLLVRYLNDGEFNPDVRKTRPAFTCPSQYAFEYEAFCGELASHCYSKATVDQNKRYVQFLITYLMENGIKSSEDIEIQHIENYLKTHEGKSVKYIGCRFSF